MDTAATLPMWVQSAGIVSIALVSTIIGVFKYLKTEVKDLNAGSTTVVDAILNEKLVKDLISVIRDAQEEQTRDSKKSQRLSQDLKESVNELNETIIVQTDSTMNLVRFINREANKNRTFGE